MKKFLLVCLGIACCMSAFANSNRFSYVHPSLERLADRIYRSPDAVRILTEASKEGEISLTISPLGPKKSNALWDRSKRMIVLNNSVRRSEGQRLCSILFEMHNALNDRQFSYWDSCAIQGLCSKTHYVEMIEKVEYNNALKTCEIIEKGIRQRLFPYDARWPIARTFKEHFQIQKEMGHSDHIAHCYDCITYASRANNTYAYKK